MIGFDKVSKHFWTREGARVVLHDADLSIARDERIGVLAQPGAGKSVVCSLLAGIERPSSGRVLPPGGDCWRLGDSTVFQVYLTAEQNVRIIADLRGVDPDWTSAYVQDLSELGPRYYESLQTYSSSMRGRLGFALSMALPCDYFIADQGISVGIGRYRDKCEMLLNERLADIGMFLITSNPSFAKRSCSSFAVLRDGGFVRCADYREAVDLFDEREDEFAAVDNLIAAWPEGRRVRG